MPLAKKKGSTRKKKPAPVIEGKPPEHPQGRSTGNLELIHRLRTYAGRPRAFNSATDLLYECGNYLHWVENNPLWEEKAFAYQGDVSVHSVAKMRAATIDGLLIYLGIAQSTWSSYKNNEEYAMVAEAVEKAIREQKFTGASADLLNANIISRDLGLADKSEQSGPNGGPIETNLNINVSFGKKR